MIKMKIEMTHLNDNAAQVFGNSFTHGTRYFKGIALYGCLRVAWTVVEQL